MTSHLHHYYTFGSVVSKRASESVTSKSCQSSTDMELIAGGQDHCVFIAKSDVKYAASNPSSYQSPCSNKANLNLASEKFIGPEELECLLDFAVNVPSGSNSGSPSVKKLKLNVQNEMAKNDLTCDALKQLLSGKGIVVDKGILEETPPSYSPFYKSRTDMFMYHAKNFKSTTVSSATCMSEELENYDEVDGEKVTSILAGVCEMKNDKKVFKQLFANMIHFASQITVKALKEGELVDRSIVYGLSIKYKEGSCNYFRMTVDYLRAKTTVEDFALIDVLNDVVARLSVAV